MHDVSLRLQIQGYSLISQGPVSLRIQTITHIFMSLLWLPYKNVLCFNAMQLW